MNNLNWNTTDYTNNFTFVHKYGEDLFNLIESEPGSSALDLGSGNGALTAKLKKKGFKVIGLDASNEFVELARKLYPDIKFVKGDATNFDLDEPVDLIFSNAVFHWIDKEKQVDLIKSIGRNLKPGGELIFEFGGYGNNKLIHQVLKKVFNNHGYNYKIPFYFPSIGEYARLLEDNGFLVTYAHLFDRLTELEGNNGLYDWFNMFLKEPFEKFKSKEEKETIKNEVLDKLKPDLYINNKWYSDYVRLRMRAIKL